MSALSMIHKQRRLDQMFEINSTVKQQRVPMHVACWIQDNHDELWDIYCTINDIKPDWIMDKGDFASFCMCIARLSSIDSPHTGIGRVGGRNRVFDFGTVSQVQKVDELYKPGEEVINDDDDDECGELP
jgi:hypothetical protein